LVIVFKEPLHLAQGFNGRYIFTGLNYIPELRAATMLDSQCEGRVWIDNYAHTLVAPVKRDHALALKARKDIGLELQLRCPLQNALGSLNSLR
jgi:hypothetical protein